MAANLPIESAIISLSGLGSSAKPSTIDRIWFFVCLAKNDGWMFQFWRIGVGFFTLPLYIRSSIFGNLWRSKARVFSLVVTLMVTLRIFYTFFSAFFSYYFLTCLPPSLRLSIRLAAKSILNLLLKRPRRGQRLSLRCALNKNDNRNILNIHWSFTPTTTTKFVAWEVFTARKLVFLRNYFNEFEFFFVEKKWHRWELCHFHSAFHSSARGTCVTCALGARATRLSLATGELI